MTAKAALLNASPNSYCPAAGELLGFGGRNPIRPGTVRPHTVQLLKLASKTNPQFEQA